MVRNSRFGTDDTLPKIPDPSSDPKLVSNQTEMLALIYQQHPNYQYLKSFLSSYHITTSNLFLPQTLRTLSSFTGGMDSLINDCFGYLDLVKFYSISVYGDHNVYLNKVIDLIVSNRTIREDTLLVDEVSDYLVSSEQELRDLITNNHMLLAMFMFCMLEMIF